MTGVTLSSDVDQIVCVLCSQAGLGFAHVIDDWSFRNEFVLGVGECDQHPDRDMDNDRWSRSSRKPHNLNLCVFHLFFGIERKKLSRV